MIIKTKVKSNRKDSKKVILAWIQKHRDFDDDIQEILNFFKDQITGSLYGQIKAFRNRKVSKT